MTNPPARSILFFAYFCRSSSQDGVRILEKLRNPNHSDDPDRFWELVEPLAAQTNYRAAQQSMKQMLDIARAIGVNDITGQLYTFGTPYADLVFKDALPAGATALLAADLNALKETVDVPAKTVVFQRMISLSITLLDDTPTLDIAWMCVIMENAFGHIAGHSKKLVDNVLSMPEYATYMEKTHKIFYNYLC